MRPPAACLLTLFLFPACAGSAQPAPEPVAAPPTVAEDPQAEERRAAEEAAEARDAAYETARSLRALGKPAEALDVARAAEKEHGEDARLRLEEAWCFFVMAEEAFRQGGDKFRVKGHLADAHLRLDQALRMETELPTARVLLARLYRYEENPDAAREVLAAQLEAHPDDVDAHRVLGDMNYSVRDWNGADRHYSRVCELDPVDGVARYRATYAKQWLRASGGVVEAGYLEAARLLPENNDPLRMLMKNAGADRARKLALLEKVVEQNPKAAWARVWMAFVLREGDAPDHDKAVVVLRAAADAAPDNPAVLYNLAIALAAAKEVPEAIEAYIGAIRLAPMGSMMDASNALDRLLYTVAAAKIDRALRDQAYDALVERNPAVGRFGNNAGLWYRDVGKDYAKSLKYYQASVDAEPEDQDFLNDCGLIYLFHMPDRKETSLPYFLKVLRLVEEDGQDPIRGYWDALENLCKYYFEIGAYEKVVECADKRVKNREYPSRWTGVWRARAKKALADDDS